MKYINLKYLLESVDDEDFFSDLGYDTGKEVTFLVDNTIMYYPKSKKELLECIREHLVKKEYNLNDIDTSKITDMSDLFRLFNSMSYNFDLSKLDISNWDVSNVKIWLLCFIAVITLILIYLNGMLVMLKIWKLCFRNVKTLIQIYLDGM